jgi:hypothetical protein
MTESWENPVSDSAVSRAVSFSFENSGGTFAVPSLFPLHPTRGYAVGIGNAARVDVSTLGPAVRAQAERITGRCCVGTWHDPVTGDWYVEQSQLFPTLAEALHIAAERSERFVWGFREQRNIPVGLDPQSDFDRFNGDPEN